jgi:hypothetical protein
VKYGCVGDILEAYYEPRLAAYERRRAAEIARLRREAQEADAKARFLQAVLDGTIDLRRASDEDILAAMIAHDLPPMSKDEVATDIDSYDYLLRLRMDRVKASAIEEQQKAVATAKVALEALEATTSRARWLTDLEAFSKAWTTMRAEREAALAGLGGRKVAAGGPKKIKKKVAA